MISCLTTEDLVRPHSFSCFGQFFSWHSLEQYHIFEQPAHSNLDGLVLHSWQVGFFFFCPMAEIGIADELFAITTLVTVDVEAVLAAITMVVGVLPDETDWIFWINGVPVADFLTTMILLPSAVSPPDFKSPCDCNC